jgi:hypothetical protein
VPTCMQSAGLSGLSDMTGSSTPNHLSNTRRGWGGGARRGGRGGGGGLGWRERVWGMVCVFRGRAVPDITISSTASASSLPGD